MLKAGDVVLANLLGATGFKARPTVVLSTDLYLATGIDVVVSELTTRLAKATTATDYHLKDWAAAGLRYPTAFRLFLGTVQSADVIWLGRTTDRDWSEIQNRLRLGLAVT
jgi:hypothetical protein